MPKEPRVRKKVLDKLDQLERDLFGQDRQVKPEKILKPYNIELNQRQQDWLEQCLQYPRTSKFEQRKQKLMEELVPTLVQQARDEVTREEMKDELSEYRREQKQMQEKELRWKLAKFLHGR